MLIQPLVLCGGSGSRLWPLSREKYPKQLLQLVGSDSLFQATLQRIIDQYPDAATTFNTRRRLDTLKLEYRANEKNADVQLGTYEQNIGLKRHP